MMGVQRGELYRSAGLWLRSLGRSQKHDTQSLADQRLPQIEMLRGLAITLVFFFHALGYAYGQSRLAWDGLFRSFDVPISFLALVPLSFGFGGVAIFFVVSGYCIYLAYERSESKTSFFLRRCFRILPPYWTLLLVFCFVPIFPIYLKGASFNWQFLSHLFLIHNFWSETHFGIAPAFWSIAVEFQLYLLYPLLAFIGIKFGWNWALFVTAIVELGLRSTNAYLIYSELEPLPQWVTGSPFFYWFSWTLGAWVAARRNALPRKPRPLHRYFWVAVLLACYFYKPLAEFLFPLFAAGTAVFLSRKPVWSHFSAWFAALGSIGVVSYSLYLAHDLLLAIVSNSAQTLTSSPLPIFLICFASFLPIFIVSTLLFASVEAPSQRLGRFAAALSQRTLRSRETPAASWTTPRTAL